MSLAHSPRIVTDGLVLCLDAANSKSYPGSGTTWTDLSGNGNNGTLRNWTSPGITTVSNVKSFYLNESTLGTGDIEISNFYTNFIAGDNTHTYEWWGYANSTNVDPFNSGDCGISCIAYGEDGGYYDSSGGREVLVGLSTSEWHQYVIVQNGTTATSYKDGIQVDTRNDWVTPTSSTRSGIIGSRGWANRTNDWYLATCKWYNRALTAQEIQQNFNALRSRFSI
jgi:hypothetical protein